MSDSTPTASAGSQLKQSVRRNTLALAAAQLASQVISLVALSILLRLISPADYGLVGMILPLGMFVRIFATLGLNVATIQRAEIRQEETSALFWLNVLLGCGTALVMAGLAPLLGRLYAQPEAAESLRNLAWALAAMSIVATLGAQHQALLEREMKLGRLSVVRIVAQLVAAVSAIAAALAGWGVWALVIQQYVELTLTSALAWFLEPWRPGWPARGAAISGHLRLGGYFAAATVVFYIGDNMDRLLVGRLVGPEAVGLYGQAYNVMIKPVYVVVTPVIALVLASLSGAAGEPETRQQMVVAYYRLMAGVLLPASIGLMVVGRDLMELLGGAAWSQAGPLLSVLSLGMFAQATIFLATPILTATGGTRRLLAGAIFVATTLCLFYLGGWWWGSRVGEPTLGIAWGYAAAVLGVVMAPYAWFALSSAGYEPATVFAALRRPAIAAILMGVIVWLGRDWLTGAATLTPLVRLAVLVPLGVIVYSALAWREVIWLMQQTGQLFGASGSRA